jgi:thymidine phosphorylase
LTPAIDASHARHAQHTIDATALRTAMSADLLPAEIIRTKRDRRTLAEPQIQAFVRGLVDGSWSEGQVAALAMAVLLNGMTRDEGVLLTRAMTHSGQVLQWRDSGIDAPVLDKHSTGGVGDKVSLMLAPIVAACGGLVPMISGRGLGHTGGTLDKLQALPGYRIHPPRTQLLAALRAAGCAIVGAGAELAPADQRLYAIRDVTATVESVPLITASILSKKLAAGLQALVLDVKLGNGAFMTDLPQAQALARNLVEVAGAAGLPAAALVTDMNQPLGRSAGNALEVAEAVAFLTGAEREPRLLEATLELSARLLRLGGLARDADDALARASAALHSGRAAEHFARMVAALGGPADVLRDAQLPAAPVQRMVLAPRDGVLAHTDTRALGLALIGLGGGRRLASDAVDARVGFSQLLPLGTRLRAGQPLLCLHAASTADADAAQAAVLAALVLVDAGAPVPAATPVVVDRIDPA